MQIGKIRIDPVIDGEAATPVELAYPGVSPDRWEPYQRAVCQHGRGVINTFGGYLVRTEDRTVIVDTGIGSKPVYPMTGGAFRSSLLSHGVDPAEVTDVLLSHLHLDHIGWTTQEGQPFFPNATYRCHRREWEFFCSPDYEMPEWERLFSHPDEDAAAVRLAPVADRVEFWDGPGEVLPGIEAVDSPGHTIAHTSFLLSSEEQRGMLVCDLVHSEPELLEDDWDLAGVHLDTAEARRSIKRIRQQLEDEDLPFAAAHFPGLPWGRLVRNGGDLVWEPIETPAHSPQA